MSNDDDRTRWSRPVNLSAALAGSPPPAPTVGRWTDTVDGSTITRGLFYPNEVHSVFGDPEAMKSWALLLASVQEIKLGRDVFYVDMEANDRSIVDRLQLLGATKKQIKSRFRYFRPDGHLTETDQVLLRRMVAKYKPTLVVLDGVTEAFSVLGLSINSPEDTAAWFRNFSRQFQVKPTDDYDGPAIVELDHVVKDREARGGWAIGSIHKKAGIKGAAYSVVSVRPLSKGKHGVSRLFLEKDSPGGVEWSAFGKHRQRLAAELHCDATVEDSVDAWFETPDEGGTVEAERSDLPLAETYDFRMLMQRVSAYVASNAGCSMRQVRAGVKGTNEHIATALDQLQGEGFIANEGTSTRRQFVVVKEFSALSVVPGSGSEAGS